MNTSSPAADSVKPIFAKGDVVEQTDEQIVLSLPGTNYRMHLAIAAGSPPLGEGINRRARGRITAQAKRIDIPQTGGRLIDPVYGRPRRIQGRVHAIDAAANTLTIQGPTAFVITPMAPQTAKDFAVGQLVSFDVERGARFEPMTQ